jgi:protein TIF31
LEDTNAFEKAAAAAAFNANDKLSIIPPRLRMPICWLEILECEIVARAAKHVLDSYMIEQSSGQPAHMIASFLSAIMSIGEESAGETEHRQAHSGSKGIPDQDEMNALTLCFDVCDEVNRYPAPSPLFKGRGEIWSDVEREIGRRYRYTLSLYNTKNSAKKGATSRALYMPLLRRICQRSGIRLVSRKYDVGRNCVTGPTVTFPIAPTDILEILPLVKHAASGEYYLLQSMAISLIQVYKHTFLCQCLASRLSPVLSTVQWDHHYMFFFLMLRPGMKLLMKATSPIEMYPLL